MGVSAQDLKEANKPTTKAMAVIRVLTPIIRPILKLGFIRQLLGKSSGARVGVILRRAKAGDHAQAAALAKEAFKELSEQKPRTWRVTGYDLRWYFMYLAADNLGKCDDDEGLDTLIEMANAEPNRSGENYAAQSYLSFARSKYLRGDRDSAIGYAQLASKIDDTWVEPDLLLGWYALVLGEGDALKYLTRAMQKDSQILPRIEADEVFKQHPHVIEKLKHVAAEAGTNLEDEPGA